MSPDAPSSASDLPQVIPVFPLAGALLLPHASRPLNVFEPRYLNMIDDAMAAERIIGLIQPQQGGSPERPTLAAVGCAGRITAFGETADGRYLITLTGVARFRLGDELPGSTPYRRVRADFAPFEADLAPTPEPEPEGAERDDLLTPLRRYLDQQGLRIDWNKAHTSPLPALVNGLAMALPFNSAELQALLEVPTPEERQQLLVALLRIDGAFDPDAPPALQ